MKQHTWKYSVGHNHLKGAGHKGNVKCVTVQQSTKNKNRKKQRSQRWYLGSVLCITIQLNKSYINFNNIFFIHVLYNHPDRIKF